MRTDPPLISVVVPVFNEAETLPKFFERLLPILDQISCRYEIVMINDGSTDSTLTDLKKIRAVNNSVKIIDLSRNFGKESALTAGLHMCNGDAVIPIDVDLQDPPEIIPDMFEHWLSGYDVVLAKRSSRNTDSYFKRHSAVAFYKFFNRLSEIEIPENAGDYRLMDRKVIEALKQLPENTRFMKGIFAWLGFKQTTIEFVREARSAGNGKWGSWKLWNFALGGVFSFSIAPLRIWTYIGFALTLVSSIYLIYIVLKTIIYGDPVQGYPSLAAIILFFNGVILFGMGLLGEYIGRIFIETKRRPVYIARETIGFDYEKF